MRPPFGYGDTVQVTVVGAVSAPLLAVAETTFPVQDLTFFTKSQVKRIRDTSAAKAPVTMIWAPRGYPVAAGILAIGNAAGGVNCQAVASNTPLWLPSASFKITQGRTSPLSRCKFRSQSPWFFPWYFKPIRKPANNAVSWVFSYHCNCSFQTRGPWYPQALAQSSNALRSWFRFLRSKDSRLSSEPNVLIIQNSKGARRPRVDYITRFQAAFTSSPSETQSLV